MKKPFVSIVVLNWNGKKYIDDFFNFISKQSYGTNNIEVLFVDNDSTDDSVDYFLSKKIKYARYVQTGKNYGYSGGNNFGFREAVGDYVLVCNNDVNLAEDCLKKLVSCAEETSADIVVPKLIFAGTTKINNAGSVLLADSDWPNKERGVGKPESSKKYNKRTEVTSFCGACPLFRRSFLEDVGLFDKHFFLYWEDTDLAWRGQKQGKKYVYEPTAVAHHNTSSTTGGETSPIFQYYVSRNRILILTKNGKLRLAFKAFLKVTRDHIFYKICDLFFAVIHRHGRKDASKRLRLGFKIIFNSIKLTPLMLCKRWGWIKEEKLLDEK